MDAPDDQVQHDERCSLVAEFDKLNACTKIRTRVGLIKLRATPTSTFRQPLDEVLGTASTVRVLRELALHGEALSPAGLAERVSLSRSSVGTAVSTLVAMELVEPVGTGRYVHYRFRSSHFLAEPLRRLFQREAVRTDRVIDSLRQFADDVEPQPDAVWLYGSVARSEDRPSSDMDIVVVAAELHHRPLLEDHFREVVLDIGDEWDITPSVVVVTETEIREGISEGEEFFISLCEDAFPAYGRLPVPVGDRG